MTCVEPKDDNFEQTCNAFVTNCAVEKDGIAQICRCETTLIGDIFGNLM